MSYDEKMKNNNVSYREDIGFVYLLYNESK